MRRATSTASAAPLSGCMRPKNRRSSEARRVEGEVAERDAVVDGGRVAEAGRPVGVADGDVGDAVLIVADTGRMRDEEKPWMVVTTGVSTSLEKVSGTKSAWLWIRSKAPARSNTCATWRISQTLASRLASSE